MHVSPQQVPRSLGHVSLSGRSSQLPRGVIHCGRHYLEVIRSTYSSRSLFDGLLGVLDLKEMAIWREHSQSTIVFSSTHFCWLSNWISILLQLCYTQQSNYVMVYSIGRGFNFYAGDFKTKEMESAGKRRRSRAAVTNISLITDVRLTLNETGLSFDPFRLA